MKISDPFRAAGWWYRVAEYHFELLCTCGVTQRADALTAREQGDATLYACPHCATDLIGVAEDDNPPLVGAAQASTPNSDDGHRMCGFVFASTVDMALMPPGQTESELDIPARPRFFLARGDRH